MGTAAISSSVVMQPAVWQQARCFLKASLLSFHGGQREHRNCCPLCFHHSDHLKSCCYTHLPLFPSGTSGEDQAPSEPICCLSEWIEGLQHLRAAPISNHSTLIGFVFKGVSSAVFSVHSTNTRIYAKGMYCCEACGVSRLLKGDRKIDR